MNRAFHWIVIVILFAVGYILADCSSAVLERRSLDVTNVDTQDTQESLDVYDTRTTASNISRSLKYNRVGGRLGGNKRLQKQQNKIELSEDYVSTQKLKSLVLSSSVTADGYPTEVNIGFVFPMFEYATPYVVNYDGVQYLAAFLMAVNDINNKNDGIHDELLPKTKLKYAVRSSTGAFIDNVKDAIALSTRVFNGSGICGCVGGADNDASNAIAQIFNGFKIDQVAYGSTGSFLSYAIPFPYYFRTCSDDAFQGYAIASVMALHYKWEYVSTFTTTDSYGTDGFLQFTQRATQLGMNILSIHQFRPGQADLTSQIQKAKETGSRIFFIFMNGNDAGNLLTQGYRLGLFKEGTQIFGSDQLFSQNTINSIGSDVAIQTVLKGALALRQSFSYTHIPAYNDFVRRWKAQNNTITRVTSGGSVQETCHDQTDDDGNFYLYKGTTTDQNGAMVQMCAGLEFSKEFTAADGSDISPFAPFAYDATIALAAGLHKTIYTNGKKTNWNGDDLNFGMTYNFSTTGVTGPITFRLGDSTGYGFGDREVGTVFDILNFDPTLYCPTNKVGGPKSIGTWSLATEVKLCDSCSPVRNSLTNEPILDRPKPIITKMATGGVAVLIVLPTLSLILTVAFFTVIFMNRAKKLVISWQPIMLYIMLFGAVLSSARVLNGSTSVTDASCALNNWFGHLAFTISFGALMIKTWRIHIIINTTMRRVKISNTHVIFATLGLNLLTVIYLAIWTGVGKPYASYKVLHLGMLQDMWQPQCDYVYPQFETALLVFEGCMLAQGARLCWLTRNVPDALNDSKPIAGAVYVITFIGIVVVCIVLLIDLDPAVASIIAGVGFSIATMTASVFIFAPKCVLLFQGAELDRNMQIVLPDSKKNQNGGKKVLATFDEENSHGREGQSEAVFAEKADKLLKGKLEEKITICREQTLKWKDMLLGFEAQALNRGSNDTNSKSNSKSSKHSYNEGVRADEDLHDDELVKTAAATD